MKYPTPKEHFLKDSATVMWWQSITEDPRYQQIRLLAELHAMRQLQGGFNTNVMLANDAIRQGITAGLNTLTQFADRGAIEKPFELPSTLHSPERPVPSISK